jgi:hypothetical protein
MRIRTATLLRANLLLVTLSANIATITYVIVGLLFGLFSDGDLPYVDSVAALTVVVMLLLRRYAQHAFDAALQARKVQLSDETPAASIELDCPRLWFVQLHLALLGRHCDE